MHILHFMPVYSPAWQFGGPILSVSRLCEGLVDQGVDVRVITTNAGLPDLPQSDLGVPQNINGVQVTYYPVDSGKGAIRSSALVQALPVQMEWADILHISSIWQPLGLPVQKAAHAAGVPVIQTLRGALGPYSWRHGLWKKAPYFWLKERPLLQRASALHCTTSQEAREIGCLGLRPRIQLLPNPIDLSQLQYSPQAGAEWRRKMRISPSVPLLLVAGRLHHKKGLDLLPKVLRGIAHQSWQIVFIGNDDDGTGIKLKTLLTANGLGNRCHWLDQLAAAELAGPYNSADVLLLPSRHENFGNVVIEALACGCGALISNRVGVGETVQSCPGVNISPRSTTRWITDLQKVLASKRPGFRSADWVLNSFSRSIVARQAIDMYLSILR